MVDIAARELNAAERRVLELVLSADVPGAELLREQTRAAQVVGLCDCGCPSVDLLVTGGPARAETASPFAAEVHVLSDDDTPDGEVLLLLEDGRLAYLEYVYYSDQPPTRWPAADRLELVQPSPRLPRNQPNP